MKNNKFLCVLLTLLVCLSMVVSVSAASEKDVIFTLESSDSMVEALDAAVVKSGETFTVLVNLDKNPGLLAAIAHIEFDSKVLELVSAESAAEGVSVPESTVAGRVSVVIGDTNDFLDRTGTAVTVSGNIAKLTFKALEEADAQTAVELKVTGSFVMFANGEYASKDASVTVSGDKLAVNIVSAEHVCDETKTVEANAVESTCTEAGKKADALCAHCGKVLVEGEEIAALDHTWDEGVVTTEPTCTEAGVLTHTCSVCGETKIGEPVPATGHAWDAGVVSKEPTCKLPGDRTYTCVCGATEVHENEVPATGEHQFGEWTVKTPATTEAEGEETRSCATCDTVESRVIAKLDPPAKSNVLLIVIIVVVVLAGAGVAAYFVLKNKKK